MPLRRFLILFLLSLYCCAGCNSGNTVDAVDSLPAYSIISDDEFAKKKKNREVAVRLEESTTESNLMAIAHKIKEGKGKSYERTNVHYYLPGMKPGEGAWATANFNPDLKVRILGSHTNETVTEE